MAAIRCSSAMNLSNYLPPVHNMSSGKLNSQNQGKNAGTAYKNIELVAQVKTSTKWSSKSIVTKQISLFELAEC